MREEQLSQGQINSVIDFNEMQKIQKWENVIVQSKCDYTY